MHVASRINKLLLRWRGLASYGLRDKAPDGHDDEGGGRRGHTSEKFHHSSPYFFMV
jgi:hypothetical protein